jgi:hypothetical protein
MFLNSKTLAPLGMALFLVLLSTYIGYLIAHNTEKSEQSEKRDKMGALIGGSIGIAVSGIIYFLYKKSTRKSKLLDKDAIEKMSRYSRSVPDYYIE